MKTKTKTKTKKATTATKTTAKGKETLVVFLLDRTGSMGTCRDEAISGFNSYVDGLGKSPNIRFTLVQFDSVSIDEIHSAVPINKVEKLDHNNYIPRAMTPLHDAVGRTIKSTQKHAKGKRVVFATLTDGHENASEEWDALTIKAEIRRREKEDDWTFVHIGVGTEGWDAAQRLASGTRSVGNVLHTNSANLKRSIGKAGVQTVAYANASMSNDTDAMNKLKGDFFAGDKDDTKE